MYKLSFFVPLSHAEDVKDAVFEAGGGIIGNYDRCSWECEGWGQFRPLPGSTPFLGDAMKLERVKELKVELVCEDACIEQVVEALKAAHPYETPAYEVYKLEAI